MMMRRTTIPNSSFLIIKKSRTPKGMRLFACSHKKGIPKGCSSCAFVSVSDNPSDHCCAASGLFRIQLTGILLRPFSTTKRILYKNGLVKEIYEGNIGTRDGGPVTDLCSHSPLIRQRLNTFAKIHAVVAVKAMPGAAAMSIKVRPFPRRKYITTRASAVPMGPEMM